jgi:quercetin dioxygenase-like cupin family protein
MRSIHVGSVLLTAALLLSVSEVAVSGAPDAQGFVRITSDEVAWHDVPNGKGAQVAILQGDPSKPGIYVQRVKFPPHVMTRPHVHPEDRHAVVLKGTWYAGTGEVFDPSKAVPLKPGSYMMHPAKAAHWDGSAGDEEVIVQIVGYGPSGTTPVQPDTEMFAEVK